MNDELFLLLLQVHFIVSETFLDKKMETPTFIWVKNGS